MIDCHVTKKMWLSVVLLIGVSALNLACLHDNIANKAAAQRPPALATRPRALPSGVVQPHGLLVVGDFHGTQEIPAFVGDVVSELAARGPVVFGLEIPRVEVPFLDRFIDSNGESAEREAMLRDPWWHAARQDGRRSIAMFNLIDTVRRLRSRGSRVDILYLDADPNSQEERDEVMARTLVAARRANPAATFVVFIGNYHARRVVAGARPGYASMAMRLVQAGISFTAIDPHYAEGSAWTCQGRTPADCGPHYTDGYDSAPLEVRMEASPDGAYDGWFGVGPIQASPPAAFPELAVDLDKKVAALRDAPDAHRGRARRAHIDKDYSRCISELLSIGQRVVDDAYNLAGCYALSGKRDAAFDQLRAVQLHGHDDLKHAETDPDLESLRADPRWQVLVAQPHLP
jgi:hypothetical protein